MSLPQRINVMKVVSFDVEAICNDIRELHLDTYGVDWEGDIPISEVLLWIEDWVADDFGTTDGLIYQDENGEEL